MSSAAFVTAALTVRFKYHFIAVFTLNIWKDPPEKNNNKRTVKSDKRSPISYLEIRIQEALYIAQFIIAWFWI